MIILEQWQWAAVALIAVTLAGTLKSSTLMWASIAATIVTAVTWYDASVPAMYQVMIFGVLTLAGMAVTDLFIKPRSSAPETADEPVKAADARRYVERTFVLTEPIVNGFGTIEIEGTRWRVRGENAPAGQTIRVLGVDGLERDLLIVTTQLE